jgi:hypothetical protein
MRDRSRLSVAVAAVVACALIVLVTPAAAGTTQVSGSAVNNLACQPPVGSPPANTGDYPPIDLTGSLDGCWYTYVSDFRLHPSGTYQETGTEIFVGCLNGSSCGTFNTMYTFTAKFTDAFAEIHGRCQHAITGGTGAFTNANGVILFKDDVVYLVYDYRGHIILGYASRLKSCEV